MPRIVPLAAYIRALPIVPQSTILGLRSDSTAAVLLPRGAVVDAVSRNQSSEEIARSFGTSSELVDYRIKRLGLWRDHVGKQIKLSRD